MAVFKPLGDAANDVVCLGLNLLDLELLIIKVMPLLLMKLLEDRLTTEPSCERCANNLVRPCCFTITNFDSLIAASTRSSIGEKL